MSGHCYEDSESGHRLSHPDSVTCEHSEADESRGEGGGGLYIVYCSENRHVIDNHFIKVFSVCYYFYLTAMTTVSQVNIELVLSP